MDSSAGGALVTGGAGFIGSHLVEALLAQGRRVKVLDNLSTGKLSNLESVRPQITFIQGDIRDAGTLNAAVRETEVVFHLAAKVSVPWTVEYPVASAEVNELGTLAVLQAARRNGVRRVVFASSCAVYGDDPRLPKREEMVPRPQSPYAVQKLAGELYARLYHGQYGLETVCLRYFNVYGPRQDPGSPYSGVISIFLTRAAEKKAPAIYGDGNQSRDFVFVQDVVQANLLAADADQASGRVFNVGCGSFVQINHLWERIGQMTGLTLKPTYMDARPGDVLLSVAGIGLAKTVLGFAPQCSFETGLALTYDWYRENRT